MIRTEDVKYEAAGAVMVGRFAIPEGDGLRPAVLVAHGAPGLDEFSRSRPEALAREGFAAFALDYHGEGRVLTDLDERSARINTIGSDPELLRTLAGAGLTALLAQPGVDPARVGAVGYCFGAVLVMELARSGADIKSVVGLHPGLTSLRPEDSRHIVGRVLMCVGADDPLSPVEARIAFEEEMRNAGVAWEMEVYGGVKHRFTDPRASEIGSPAMEYSREAADRSWRSMLDLLARTLG